MAADGRKVKKVYDAVPGLVSVGMLVVALVIADVQLFLISTVLGIVFIIAVPLSVLPVLYWYCRKCSHAAAGTCRHVIFGRMARALFTLKASAPYSAGEVVLSLTLLALVMLFPQYWLIRHCVFFIVFWVLMAAAFLVVRIGVCPVCANAYCPLCPAKKWRGK